MNHRRIFSFLIFVTVALVWCASFTRVKSQAESRSAQTPVNDPESVTGMVSHTFTYQGVLKENGAPVTGSRDMTFNLYSNASCKPSSLQSIGPVSVTVNNGLFNVPLAFDAANFNGQELWLELLVSSQVMGCQELRPVPYALSLRPGATIEGYVSTGGSGGNALSVVNDSGQPGATGVSGEAQSAGVSGTSTTTVGSGVKGVNQHGGNAIYADGKIFSSADSELYLSPYSMQVFYNGDILAEGGGGVRIIRTGGIEHVVGITPIPIYGTLFGSAMYIKSIFVCYLASGPDNHIQSTSIDKNDGMTSTVAYYFDNTERASTSHECYTLTMPTPRLVVDNSSWVYIDFDLSPAGYVEIYTLKLTLTEQQN
jgi:hypothetical protein